MIGFAAWHCYSTRCGTGRHIEGRPMEGDVWQVLGEAKGLFGRVVHGSGDSACADHTLGERRADELPT